METTKEVFINNLRRIRESRGFTQASFAEKVGYSTRGYQKYEQGLSDPSPDILDLFAKNLGCTPADLILDNPPPATESETYQLAYLRELMGDAPEDLIRAIRDADEALRKDVRIALGLHKPSAGQQSKPKQKPNKAQG